MPDSEQSLEQGWTFLRCVCRPWLARRVPVFSVGSGGEHTLPTVLYETPRMPVRGRGWVLDIARRGECSGRVQTRISSGIGSGPSLSGDDFGTSGVPFEIRTRSTAGSRDESTNSQCSAQGPGSATGHHPYRDRGRQRQRCGLRSGTHRGSRKGQAMVSPFKPNGDTIHRCPT